MPSSINQEILVKMRQMAIENAKNAYVPYSNFPVSAVVKTKDDRYFLGINVENAAYGLCSCAERNALFYYYSYGNKKEDIEVLLVFTDKNIITTPCGGCRQIIRELCPKDTVVAMSNIDIIETKSIEELLPQSFGAEDLNQ